MDAPLGTLAFTWSPPLILRSEPKKKRKAAEIEEECVYHEGLEKTEFPEGGRSQEC